MMTLHTRIAVTAPGLDLRGAFDKARDLIGATPQNKFRESPDLASDNAYWHTMPRGFHMDMGQGLPALMWVEESDGQPEGHDKYCDEGCSGEYHDPAHFVMFNFDTAYGYRAPNGASCGDFHAYLVREVGRWLSSGDLSWRWYDESGSGWGTTKDNLSSLGDPEVGRPGSPVVRTGPEDGRRSFGNLVTALVEGGVR